MTKRGEILTLQATTWMKLENLRLSERARHKRSRAACFHLHEMPGTGKSIGIKSRLVVARGWQ